MSLLKLLFFVGVSVTMMVSVLAVVDYNDESPRMPMESDGIMNDEDNNEYIDENAILFDEAATTIPPPDMLHDIEYDEDVNEDDGKDAIIFDEPATTFPPPDMEHDIEYDEDVNEDDGKDAIIFDEPAVKRRVSGKLPIPLTFHENFEKIFETLFGYKVSDFIAKIDEYKKDFIAKIDENKKAKKNAKN